MKYKPPAATFCTVHVWPAGTTKSSAPRASNESFAVSKSCELVAFVPALLFWSYNTTVLPPGVHVAAAVAVDVDVAVAVAVGVFVFVLVGVLVEVFVEVGVGVLVLVLVGVLVAVFVAVEVGVFVFVAAAVGVLVGVLPPGIVTLPLVGTATGSPSLNANPG